MGVRTRDRLLFESHGNGVRVRAVRDPKSFSKIPRYRQSRNWGRPEEHSINGCDARTMTKALDVNVLIALWDRTSDFSLAAQNFVEAAFNRGNLVVATPDSQN